MAFTYIQGFESAETSPGTLIQTEVNGGNDGVYDIADWDHSYSARTIYIDDQITHSGNRSLRHELLQSGQGSGYHTGMHSEIVPPYSVLRNDTNNDTQGREIWARMWLYVPDGFNWRGTGTSSEPKTFRVWMRQNWFINMYMTIARGGSAVPSWYQDQYPYGAILGMRLERIHRQGYGPNVPWNPGAVDVSYRAPFDNNYEAYTLPYGQWSYLELYCYMTSNSSQGKVRAWLNGTLMYEMTTDTWTTVDTKPPSTGNRPGIQTFSTNYAGMNGDAGNLWSDDYIITNDRSYVEANGTTDDFGNWMIGPGGSSNGGGNGDNKGPVITNISAQTGETTATITWNTDENSNSVVDYGATESRGTIVYGNNNTKKHVVELTDLEVDTQYYYRLSSKDASGNVTLIEKNRTFTTGSQPEPGEVALNDLTDVSLSTPSRGQILIYDGTQWVNRGIDIDSLVENKVVEVLERAKIIVT